MAIDSNDENHIPFMSDEDLEDDAPIDLNKIGRRFDNLLNALKQADKGLDKLVDIKPLMNQ